MIHVAFEVARKRLEFVLALIYAELKRSQLDDLKPSSSNQK